LTDLSRLLPAEFNHERFCPPVTTRLSDDGLVMVNVGIALRWVHNPVTRGVGAVAGKRQMKKGARERTVRTTSWENKIHGD